MANAILFYRTPISRGAGSGDGFDDPQTLNAPQKLEFIPSPDLVNSLDESYQNNIVRKIPPKSAGRRIIQTDEGLASWLPIISGNFEIDAGEVRTKLHLFRKLEDEGIPIILFTNRELELYHPYWLDFGEIESDIPEKYPHSLSDLSRNSIARYLSQQ